MAEIIKEMEEIKKIGGLREEIINLMEENLKLEGTVKVLNLEMIETENRRNSILSSSSGVLSRKTVESHSTTHKENLSYFTKSKLSTREPLTFKPTHSLR